MLAALVAALIVPVGFALSLESPIPAQSSAAFAQSATYLPAVSDSARLFLVGAFLIGIAAFVRKSA
jgi:hypothetical protein